MLAILPLPVWLGAIRLLRSEFGTGWGGIPHILFCGIAGFAFDPLDPKIPFAVWLILCGFADRHSEAFSREEDIQAKKIVRVVMRRTKKRRQRANNLDAKSHPSFGGGAGG